MRIATTRFATTVMSVITLALMAPSTAHAAVIPFGTELIVNGTFRDGSPPADWNGSVSGSGTHFFANVNSDNMQPWYNGIDLPATMYSDGGGVASASGSQTFTAVDGFVAGTTGVLFTGDYASQGNWTGVTFQISAQTTGGNNWTTGAMDTSSWLPLKADPYFGSVLQTFSVLIPVTDLSPGTTFSVQLAYNAAAGGGGREIQFGNFSAVTVGEAVIPTPAALPAGLALLGLAAMRRRA